MGSKNLSSCCRFSIRILNTKQFKKRKGERQNDRKTDRGHVQEAVPEFEAVILPWSKDGQEPDGTTSCAENGILGLEWKNRDGSGIYRSRYIIDLEKGNIIITGDCGNAIACFSNPLKVEQLSGLVSGIGYFAEKIRCGEGMFTYEPEDIEEDLQFAEEYWRKKHHENWSDTITNAVKGSARGFPKMR